jgi:hypothetical protein
MNLLKEQLTNLIAKRMDETTPLFPLPSLVKKPNEKAFYNVQLSNWNMFASITSTVGP